MQTMTVSKYCRAFVRRCVLYHRARKSLTRLQQLQYILIHKKKQCSPGLLEIIQSSALSHHTHTTTHHPPCVPEPPTALMHGIGRWPRHIVRFRERITLGLVTNRTACFSTATEQVDCTI